MEIKQIKGTVANKGKITGKIKIVDTADMKTVIEPGEIIVARYSSSHLVQFIKQASGVITEEGGLTSHAALLSRELGIPCIVAAKGALETLKDGNLVDMDANNGIITVLK